MIIEGKFNRIENIFVPGELDNQMIGMFKAFCDIEQFKDVKVYLMPDAHPVKGCAIGSVLETGDLIIPSFVGVDIGCGVSCYLLKKKRKLNLDDFDKAVRSQAKESHRREIAEKLFDVIDYRIGFDEKNMCINKKTKNVFCEKAIVQLGTVGGGNHFIELDEYDDEHYMLVIHSGSRGIGSAIATHYMDIAYKECHEKYPHIPYEFSFFTTELSKENYMIEVEKAEEFARLNRDLIAFNIRERCKRYFEYEVDLSLTCSVHNSIDRFTPGGYKIRKGAIRAYKGNKIIIPINMKDGVLIGRVKEDRENWSYCMPHGMGRKYSRSEVANYVTLNGLKKEMNGIYTTCLSKDIIEEAPEAYKPFDTVFSMISDNLEDVKICRPVYNYKQH